MSCGVITDIFNTQNCINAYNNCASTQQVQVFLWQQINKLQIFCNNFNHAQGLKNGEFETGISNNSQAIAIIQNEIKTLQTLASNLSISQTETIRDVNAFKLSVDQTLSLYQQSINEIVRNVDTLTVDGQALQKRVSLLESQTDLAKLQEIIKSWEEIKREFSTELNQTKEELETLLELRVEELSIVWNKKFNELEIDVTEKLTVILRSTNANSTDITNLFQSIKEIHALIEANDVEYAEKFEIIEAQFREEMLALEERSINYTDAEIVKSTAAILALFESFKIEINKTLADYFNDMTAKFGLLNDKFNALQVEFNQYVISNDKEIADLFQQNMVIQKHLNDNYQLAYDANKNANNAIELATHVAKIVDGYAERFVYYDYYLVNINESLRYINSAVVRGILEAEGNYDVKVGVIVVDSETATLNVNPEYYAIIGSENEYKNSQSVTLTEFMNVLVISRVDHTQFTAQFRGLLDGRVMFQLMNCCGNEWDQVYYPLEIIEGDMTTTPVEIDIHPAPKPPVKPEPECKPLKVMLVDKDCEQLDLKPRDGRDGRDGLNGLNGRDGASVDDITLTVKP